MNEPFDGDLVPNVPRGGLTAHSPFPLLGRNWSNPRGGQQDKLTGNPSTPERTGDTSGAPSPRKQGLSECNIRGQGDREFAENAELENRIGISW